METSVPSSAPPSERPTGPDSAIAAVTDLFARFGTSDYVGEAVSQVEHAVQCGARARASGAPPHVVVAALLHDVGHLLGLADPHSHGRMGECGVTRHEHVGADWLAGLGFPAGTTELVRRHVDAKRYLTAIDPGYHGRLSDASRTTLVYQGGPMSDAEVAAFEVDPLKPAILALRLWDEEAKDTTIAGTIPLSAFEADMRTVVDSATAVPTVV